MPATFRVDVYYSPERSIERVLFALVRAMLSLRNVFIPSIIKVDAYHSEMLGRDIVVFLLCIQKTLTREDIKKLDLEQAVPEGASLEVEIVKVEPHQEGTTVVFYRYDIVDETAINIVYNILSKEIGLRKKES